MASKKQVLEFKGASSLGLVTKMTCGARTISVKASHGIPSLHSGLVEAGREPQDVTTYFSPSDTQIVYIESLKYTIGTANGDAVLVDAREAAAKGVELLNILDTLDVTLIAKAIPPAPEKKSGAKKPKAPKA